MNPALKVAAFAGLLVVTFAIAYLVGGVVPRLSF